MTHLRCKRKSVRFEQKFKVGYILKEISIEPREIDTAYK